MLHICHPRGGEEPCWHRHYAIPNHGFAPLRKNKAFLSCAGYGLLFLDYQQNLHSVVLVGP